MNKTGHIKYICSAMFFCFAFAFLFAPFFLKAEIGLSEQDLYDLEMFGFFEDGEFKLEDWASEIYNSPLLKQLQDMYGLTGENQGLFELNMSPQTIPGPQEKVGFWIATTFNSKSSLFVWSVNGEVVESGYGLSRFNFTTGEVGESMTVKVEMRTDNNIVRSESITITPARVDIVWQADTYTPPPYKGKALSSRFDTGKIEFVALTDFTGTGAVENPNDYIFSWKVNGADFRSGRGVNAISFDMSNIFTRSGVRVSVQPINSKLSFRKNSDFPTSGNPEVMMYVSEPNTYGINYAKAIDHFDNNFFESGMNLHIVAEPFFFSEKETMEGSLKTTWLMNREELSIFENSSVAYFGIDRDFVGTSLVSVRINSAENRRVNANSEAVLRVNGLGN